MRLPGVKRAIVGAGNRGLAMEPFGGEPAEVGESVRRRCYRGGTGHRLEVSASAVPLVASRELEIQTWTRHTKAQTSATTVDSSARRRVSVVISSRSGTP